jgi:hypothetical protein
MNEIGFLQDFTASLGSFITGSDPSSLEASEGVKDLIERARASTVEDPLFVVSIATPTNVAAALLIAADIVGNLVVLWDACIMEYRNSWPLSHRLPKPGLRPGRYACAV